MYTMHFVTKDLSCRFFDIMLIISTRWKIQRIGLDPGSQHPQSAPNVPESSQGSSSCYYSKASDASTCGEPWPWASAHRAWSLFCPLPHDHVWNSQPTWFCLQANNIEKMSPLGRASKKNTPP